MTYLQLYRDQVEETKRSNLAVETETHRHNVVAEALQEKGYLETRRTNMANEAIRQMSVYEDIRANQAREQIQRDTLAETSRHNMEAEGIDLAKVTQQSYANYTQRLAQAETARHNAAVEKLDADELQLENKKHELNKAKFIVDEAEEVIGSIYDVIVREPRNTLLSLLNILRGKGGSGVAGLLTGGN